MTEQGRQQRNAMRLLGCYPVFRAQLAAVLADMESRGFRPRIQDAWRAPADELAAYQSGHSQVQRGFHSCTGPDGKTPEALAADVLDDDNPLAPPTAYLLTLAYCARRQGLRTGILWGLAPGVRTNVDAVIDAGHFTVKVPVGWDPTHVETTAVTISEALAGKRPAGVVA